MQPWIDRMIAAVSMETGKRRTAAAQEIPPEAWWVSWPPTLRRIRGDPDKPDK
jgi:hypothetical protein